jgi:hypothetical protein
MPHSSDLGWPEWKHEANRGESGGGRGGDRWARGELRRAAGPGAACGARGSAQDARSDPRDGGLGLPCPRPARVEPCAPGAGPAPGWCPTADQARSPPTRSGADPPRLAAGDPRAGSTHPAAAGRTPPRGAGAGAARRSQPAPPRRRLAVSEPGPRARMFACHPSDVLARSASRSPRSRSGAACRPRSGGRS